MRVPESRVVVSVSPLSAFLGSDRFIILSKLIADGTSSLQMNVVVAKKILDEREKSFVILAC